MALLWQFRKCCSPSFCSWKESSAKTSYKEAAKNCWYQFLKYKVLKLVIFDFCFTAEKNILKKPMFSYTKSTDEY